MDNQEIWRDVKGYEGLYAVSNWGRVKSLNYRHTGKEKILRPGKHVDGYLSVVLCRCGRPKMYRVNRLVLSTFNPIDGMENLDCNHLDENKLNNRLENLEWVTHKENCNHGTRNDRVAEKQSIPIVQLSLEDKYIRSWKSSYDAERGGFNHGNINSCCKNKFNREGNNIYKGFKWMYLSEFLDKNNGLLID